MNGLVVIDEKDFHHVKPSVGAAEKPAHNTFCGSQINTEQLVSCSDVAGRPDEVCDAAGALVTDHEQLDRLRIVS